jgi:carbamoylphosphate synthase large subunit
MFKEVLTKLAFGFEKFAKINKELANLVKQVCEVGRILRTWEASRSLRTSRFREK